MNAPDEFEGRELMTAEAGTVALLNRGEIDMQIATAHKYPRSIAQFRRDVMDMVTISEQFAQECIYALPRDGKVIEGPSARFAEVIASAWGNGRAGARVVSDQGEFVTAQGVYHDLQKNVAITYEVQRRITGKGGKRYSADMIGVTANAACSIALRNAILKGIPKAFWTDMYEGARRTAMGDVKTLPNRRAEAFKALQGYGISKEQALAKLRVQGEADIGQEQLLILRGLLTAIKEGDTTPEQAFAPEDGAQTGVTMPPRKPPATTTAPPVAEPPAQPPADGAQDSLLADEPAAAPAPAPAATAPAGEFMATTAEKQHLRQKAARAGVDLSMALTAAGVEVDPDTLDGLTKRQFHAVKSKLPA